MERTKKQIFPFYAVFIIFSLFFCFQNILMKEIPQKFILALGIVAFDCFLYFLLKYCLKKELSIEKLYFIFASIFGFCYLFCFPISQFPDAEADYVRSLEISKFQFISPKNGEGFSTNIGKVYSAKNYNTQNKVANLKLNKEKKFYFYATKSLYAFVCYIPQSLGVGLGSFLHLSIMWGTLLGKLFNYLFFMLLIYLSIKYIPYKKTLVFLIALLPITVQEAISLAPDAMTIASSIAFVSFILYLKEGDKKITFFHFIGLVGLMILIALCKIVYLPLCFLVFLIPKEKFKSPKEKYIFCILSSVFVIILSLSWLKISSSYLTSFKGKSDSGLQLKFILTNPIRYLLIIFHTIEMFFFSYLEEMVGISLGTLNVRNSSIFVFFLLIVLGIFLFKPQNGKKKVLNIKESIFTFCMIIGTIFLTFTSLYMQWTTPYKEYVDGIQGRYFLPLLLPLGLLFMVKDKKINKKISYLCTMANIISLIAIVTTFI